MTVHRISPEPPSIRAQIRELAGARDLYSLVLGREIRVRYKQTALGVLWVILQPLVPALIFAVVFGTFARLPSDGAPYLLFALSGLVLFGLFSNAVSRASSSFLRDGNLVTKVYFPRAILPLASGSAAAVDFIVGSGVLAVAMVISGVAPTAGLVVAPLIAMVTLALALVVGLAVAALTAHFRDFAIAVPFVLQVLLYASPVVYSSSLLPAQWQPLYALNPMVALVESFRWAVIGTPAPPPATLAIGLMVTIALAGLAVAVFSRASRDISDVV